METYDPFDPPDRDGWESLDEQERIILVEAYHRQTREEIPNKGPHAIVHVIVENQAVLGDEIPVQATLERLMREGLDRHDAIHAVGSILMNYLNQLLVAGDAGQDANESYYAELRELTAAKWLREYS